MCVMVACFPPKNKTKEETHQRNTSETHICGHFNLRLEEERS